jgi:hypothetical protein
MARKGRGVGLTVLLARLHAPARAAAPGSLRVMTTARCSSTYSSDVSVLRDEARTHEGTFAFVSCVLVLQRVMRNSRTSMLVAVLLAIGCNGFVGEATVKAPAAEKAVPSMTALDQARAALNRRGSGEAVGNISLAGTRSVVS